MPHPSETPETSETPVTSETPATFETSETPETFETSETPETFDTSETLETKAVRWINLQISFAIHFHCALIVKDLIECTSALPMGRPS